MNRALASLSFVALFSGPLFGQSADTPPTAKTPLSFEAADIHPSAPSTFPFMQGGLIRGDRYELRNATMVDLIRTAYGVDADNVLGGPSWLESDRFDVLAKTPPNTSLEIVKPMLQALLADRFQLKLHNETKPVAVFVLSMGKGKPKLREAEGSGNTGCQGQPQNPQPGAIPYAIVQCRNMTMELFAQNLRRMAGAYMTNPVVDSTGLKGAWDFEIKWTGRALLAQAGSDGISIFDAVDKQLGLKLEAQKLPTPVIVVDSVNRKPTDNLPGVTKSLPAVATPAEFEVADIKPGKPDSTQRMFRVQPGGRVDIQGMTLQFLITFAWDINAGTLIGAPKWLDSNRFDIVAKAPTAGPMGIDSFRVMLRALLEDRFNLATHKEDQNVNVYALVAPKGPAKLKKADDSSRAVCKYTGPVPDNPALSTSYTCQNTTMAQLAEKLHEIAPVYIDHPVIDASGLEGGWDFVLSWTPRGMFDNQRGGRGGEANQPQPGAVGTASDPSGSLTVFEALDKELGLKAELRKHSAPVLVIDHVEPKPTDN
jgi:uncharacterized protein (TIGR03435 family)